MSPRRYEMRQRAETAAETRDRIVRATMQVHQRRGITPATVREIADEADVSPGTVLRHFPRMEQLVEACGRMTADMFPFPGPEVVAGVEGDDARVHAAVRAVYAFYDAMPGIWPMIEGERPRWPVVDELAREDEATRRALLDAALPRGRGRRRSRALALAMALTTWNARAALRDEGLDLDAATDAAVDAVLTAADAAR